MSAFDVLRFFNRRPRLVILMAGILVAFAIWNSWSEEASRLDGALMFLLFVLMVPAVFAVGFLAHHACTGRWLITDVGISTGLEELKWTDVKSWKVSAIEANPGIHALEVVAKNTRRSLTIVVGTEVDPSSLKAIFEKYISEC
jgi:hypothetical protein